LLTRTLKKKQTEIQFSCRHKVQFSSVLTFGNGKMQGFFFSLHQKFRTGKGLLYIYIYLLIYLAAALKPTDIMNTHPVSVMLQRPPRAQRIKKKTMQVSSCLSTINNIVLYMQLQ